jgi:hypothetical protein
MDPTNMHKLIHRMKKFHCHFLKENYEAPKTWLAVYLIKPTKIRTDLIALLSKYVVLPHHIQEENKLQVMNYCDMGGRYSFLSTLPYIHSEVVKTL